MRTSWHVAIVGLTAAVAFLAGTPNSRAEDKTPAAAPAPVVQPRVAVRSFAAKGVDQAVAATLETSFCTALAAHNLDVLCPDDLNAILSQKQQELGVGACDNEEECVKNIATMTHSSRVVTGEVSKLGDTFVISVTMIDIASSKVIGRANDKTSHIEDLLNKLPELAKKLASGAK